MKRYSIQEFLLTYVSWQSLLQRAHYKGRSRKDALTYSGVSVVARWLKFENFIEDMGPRPGRKFTLDRFPDQRGNYEPGNCRWATAKEQAANTKQARLLTLNGETHPIAEWARKTGIGRSAIQFRLRSGWSVYDALTIPTNEINSAYRSFAEGRVSGKKLSSTSVSEIVRRARAGETATALARVFGVSPPAVCRVLKQFNVTLKKGRPKKLLWASAEKLGPGKIQWLTT